MADDDQEEESSTGAVRYNTMPSLIALQQMRNRLHLAKVGKKLMKWTALATGRELRRLAGEIRKTYKCFRIEMRDAFMLLARGRFFYPNLNKMVLENIGTEAGVHVYTTIRSISGVKVIHMNIEDTHFESYAHLGIAVGGETITKAKNLWRDLLKMLVQLAEERISFRDLEVAHKNATKRENVLKKIVVPRIKATIAYILIELEELDREEKHRIKMIKHKMTEKHKPKKEKEYNLLIPDEEDPTIYPIHGPVLKAVDVSEKVQQEQVQIEQTISLTPTQSEKLAETNIMTEKHKPKKEEDPAICPICGPVPNAVKQPISVPPMQSEIRPAKEISLKSADPQKLLSKDERSLNVKIDAIKKYMNDFILLSKSFVEKGVASVDVQAFHKACEEVRGKIEECLKRETMSNEMDENLKYKLDHLKCHLHEIINITKDFRDKSDLSPSTANVVLSCEKNDDKLNISVKKSEPPLEDLQTQVEDNIQVIKDTEKAGILKQSVHDYVKCSCDNIAEATAQKQADTSSSSENFLAYCKEFQKKIDDFLMNKDKIPPTEGVSGKLFNKMDVKNTKHISASIKELINSCEHTKRLIEFKDESHKDNQSKKSNELQYNIDDIIKIIDMLQTDGLVTKSIELLKNKLESAKAEINEDEYAQPCLDAGRMIYPSCSGACTCNQAVQSFDLLCKICKDSPEMVPELDNLPPPCSFCQGLKETDTAHEFPCQTCSENQTAEELVREVTTYSSLDQSETHEDTCDFCRSLKNEKMIQNSSVLQQKDGEEVEKVDDTLGYFEKKVRKITRVTRTMNSDGTIREEKDIITIRTEKHDPKKIRFNDNDDEFANDASYERLDDEENKLENNKHQDTKTDSKKKK